MFSDKMKAIKSRERNVLGNYSNEPETVVNRRNTLIRCDTSTSRRGGVHNYRDVQYRLEIIRNGLRIAHTLPNSLEKSGKLNI